jgi:membrane fusion protein, multidrug efflux system
MTRKNIFKSVLAIIIAIQFGCNSDKSELELKKEELNTSKEQLIELQSKIAGLKKEIKLLEGDSLKVSHTPVKVITVQSNYFERGIQVHGNVEASNNILVNAEVVAPVVNIFVKEGSKVNKGDVLITLDATSIDNNILELKNSLEFANTMFAKQQELKDKNIGTEVQYLEAKNRKESIEKSLQTLLSQKEKFSITAPMNGVVDQILPKVGEMVSPQFPVLRLINLEKIYVEAEVTESLLGKIKEQDEVNVLFSSINYETKGKIAQIGQYINPNNRTFKIKIALNEQNNLLKPNLLSVIYVVDYKVDSAISVSSKIIQEDIKGNFVFVVNNEEVVEKRYVKIGKMNTSHTEIVEGLAIGERVVADGGRSIVQGEKVSVQ